MDYRLIRFDQPGFLSELELPIDTVGKREYNPHCV